MQWIKTEPTSNYKNSTDRESNENQPSVIVNQPRSMPTALAERSRLYRARQRAARQEKQSNSEPRPTPKTSAERVRAFRARQKKAQQIQHNLQQYLAKDDVTSDTTHRCITCSSNGNFNLT